MDFSAFFKGILLIAALTTDSFVVSFAYGMGKTRLPFGLVAGMNFIMSALLGVSMTMGNFLAVILPEEFTSWAGTLLLMAIGLYRLGEFFLKKQKPSEKEKLKSLSGAEGILLAFVLSLDSLAVGLGTGLVQSGEIFFIGGSFVGGILMMETGWKLGFHFRRSFHRDFSWISGVCLLLLALGSIWKQ